MGLFSKRLNGAAEKFPGKGLPLLSDKEPSDQHGAALPEKVLVRDPTAAPQALQN